MSFMEFVDTMICLVLAMKATGYYAVLGMDEEMEDAFGIFVQLDPLVSEELESWSTLKWIVLFVPYVIAFTIRITLLMRKTNEEIDEFIRSRLPG